MDYPSNSQQGKERAAPAKAEAKKVEQVVTGKVTQRKKPLGKRFRETFVGGDAKGVWEYVALDVVVPAIKDTIVDAIQTAVERMFFPDARPSTRSRFHSSPVGHVAYNRISSGGSSHRDPRREEPRSMSRRGRSTFDFGEIILDTRVEADEVIEHLFELVSRFDQVTVADLYDLVGITGSFTDNKWGWTDIRGAGVQRLPRGGYLLDLPRPEPLD